MSNQRPIYLCSFYSNKYQYRFAARRLNRQVNKLNLFEDTFVYNENTFFDLLKSKYSDLFEIFQEEKVSPGFAYWAWKPLIINETLKLIPDQSILLYVDIGCDLIQNDFFWNKIKEKIIKNKIITAYSFGYSAKKYGEMEYNWSKIKIFKELKISTTDQNSSQYQATWIMLVNNIKNRELIQEWQHYCTANNLDLVKPEIGKNLLNSKLVESKNDQAVFSCLLKKNHLNPTVATTEDMSIIRASRNLSVFSFSKISLINKTIKYFERRMIKILNKYFNS
jgi:hypothetical protein